MNTYIQLSVPDAFRGRVNSANSMASRCIVPLSRGMAGLLLDRIGLTAMFLVMGLGFCATALVGLMDPGFRRARMPTSQQKLGEARGDPDVLAAANAVSE